MASPLLSIRVAQELMNAILVPISYTNAAAIDGNKLQVVIDVLNTHFNPAPENGIGQQRRRLELVEKLLAAMVNQNL